MEWEVWSQLEVHLIQNLADDGFVVHRRAGNAFVPDAVEGQAGKLAHLQYTCMQVSE